MDCYRRFTREDTCFDLIWGIKPMRATLTPLVIFTQALIPVRKTPQA